MTARIRRLVLALMALSGFALLGSSVQGMASIDQQLRSSAQSLPVEREHDCPLEPRVRDREV